MRTKLLALLVVTLSLIQAGCSTSFRATGPKGNGVAAGTGIGQDPFPVVPPDHIPQPPPLPPPPAYQ